MLPESEQMSGQLFNAAGKRLYLTREERDAFLTAADQLPREQRSLCHLLAYTGCRITEALELTADRIDPAGKAITFETLKKRRRGIYRAVPVPAPLLDMLALAHDLKKARATKPLRLWTIGRTRAWQIVTTTMKAARIRGPQATPKGLRHGFGVQAIQAGIPLNLLQRWLGHAQISTTAIYANALGPEERSIAERMWR